MIAVIDYDVGNLGAVANMLRRLGVACEITSEPDAVRRASHIILPGNGSFDACMTSFRNTGLIPLIEKRVHVEGVPLLGICVGAQMLGLGSEEGSLPGLGWLDMHVKRLPLALDCRLPHMGWNEANPVPHNHYLTRNMEADTRFYFLHSFYMEPRDPEDVLMTSTYGIQFASAVARNSIVGVQFHPEKSHRFGKQLLANFAGHS